jgi:hypothetical protein
MARLCERPGCSIVADVAYGFDAEHLVVWLDGFHAAQGASSGVLCRRHADAMVVPLGWMLDDRRDPAPRLFRPPAEAPTGPMIRPRPRRMKGDATGSVQLQLDEFERPVDLAAAVEDAVSEALALGAVHDTEDGELADPSVDHLDIDDVAAIGEGPIDEAPIDEADQTDVLPWQPVFDERDDLHGLLKARGRLLSRAFNGIGVDET